MITKLRAQKLLKNDNYFIKKITVTNWCSCMFQGNVTISSFTASSNEVPTVICI